MRETGAMPTRMTPAEAWKWLQAGNERFVYGELHERDPIAERGRVAQQQSPNAVVLTCGDSRVTPEYVFDCGLGDLIVVRTAAGVAATAALAMIEFAVDALQAPLVVVMAHQRCAAVTLACSREKSESPHIGKVMRAVRPLVPDGALTDAQIEDVIRRNARQVAASLADRSLILHDAVTRGRLELRPCYYSLDSGEVSAL